MMIKKIERLICIEKVLTPFASNYGPHAPKEHRKISKAVVYL